MPLAEKSGYVQRGVGLCPGMGMSGVCPAVVYIGICPWGTGMSGGRGMPWVLGYDPVSGWQVGGIHPTGMLSCLWLQIEFSQRRLL